MSAADDWLKTLDNLESRGWPPDVVSATLALGGQLGAGRAAELAQRLEELGYREVRVETDEEHGLAEVVCRAGSNGHGWEVRVGRELTESGHYRKARHLQREIEALREGPYTLERNGDRTTFSSLADLVGHVFEIAKKGLGIQRYKGLGEMNPRQLWETTMDPANRRLLQVTVEDAAHTDELFTILMGDAVEPRRNFIETNALEARNLDI